MSKIKNLIAVIFIALVCIGCTTYSLRPRENDSTELIIKRGEAILFSEGTSVDIFLQPQCYENYFYLHLLVVNKSDSKIFVNDESARFFEYISDYKDWEIVKTYESTEFFTMRENEIRTAQVLKVVSATLDSINAGRSSSTTTGTYNYHGYSRKNFYRGYGSYKQNTITYDSTKAAIEREIIFNDVNSYIDNTNSELEYLKQVLFFPSDIFPNEEYYGIIICEQGSKSQAPMRFEIQILNDVFSFDFDKIED